MGLWAFLTAWILFALLGLWSSWRLFKIENKIRWLEAELEASYRINKRNTDAAIDAFYDELCEEIKCKPNGNT